MLPIKALMKISKLFKMYICQQHKMLHKQTYLNEQPLFFVFLGHLCKWCVGEATSFNKKGNITLDSLQRFEMGEAS